MKKIVLQPGQQINGWTIISSAPQNKWGARCQCGFVTTKVLSELKRTQECRSCSKRGSKSPSWRGGKHLTSEGYVLLTNPENYFGKLRRITANTGVALEHVVVMSRHLGRPLYDDENVHHKNGVRTDNRLENLELWVKPQPTGIRVADAITWAREVLRRYV